MSSQTNHLNKQKQRAPPRLVDPMALKQGWEQHGKATGTVKNYVGILGQADEWLPSQLVKLISKQAQWHKSLRTEGLPMELTTCPHGELILTDGSASDAFRTPMECTPYLILLFAWSKCIKTGGTSEGPASPPAGASVLKTIHAAFVWWFENLQVV